jgi:hypothetical protein
MITLLLLRKRSIEQGIYILIWRGSKRCVRLSNKICDHGGFSVWLSACLHFSREGCIVTIRVYSN